MKQRLKEGETFGYWTVKEYNKDKYEYFCQCICGNIKSVRKHSLISRKSKSCGCKQKEKVGNNIIKNGYLSIRKKIFDNYKRAAKRRKYEFNISFDFFSKLITSNCYYCGSSPNMSCKYGRGKLATDYSKFKYNGIDRLNNDIGYIQNNCVPCCKICNNSKATLSLKEWKAWIKKIYNKFNS